MSFVSIIAQENFISVVSDGLVIDLETFEEKAQNYQKFRKINEKQFVAVTGNQGIADEIFKWFPFAELKYHLYKNAEIVREKLMVGDFYEKAPTQFCIGGLNTENEIEYHIFTNNPADKIHSIKPKNDEISYHFMLSNNNGITDEIIDDKFVELLRFFGYKSPTKVLKVQKDLNDFVAQQDKSVNRIKFDFVAKK